MSSLVALILAATVAFAPEAWTEAQIRRAVRPRARVRQYKRFRGGRYFGWSCPCNAVVENSA